MTCRSGLADPSGSWVVTGNPRVTCFEWETRFRAHGMGMVYETRPCHESMHLTHNYFSDMVFLAFKREHHEPD